MPDMKTALSTALQTWTQGDKEPDVQAPAPAPEPKRAGFKPTNNVSRALFDFVKAHPGLTRVNITSAMSQQGYNPASVMSLTGQYLTGGLFRSVDGHVFANKDEYVPIKASDLLSARVAKQNARLQKMHKPRNEAVDELRETLQRKEKEGLAFNPQALVDKLTLPQARQLYDLLRRYLSV